jgi:hypothetical protein
MRVLFTALITSVFLIIQYLDNPRLCGTFLAAGTNFWARVTQDKEIRLDGLRWMSRTEIEKLLPLNRSVLWWLLNSPVVKAKLAENPWVGSVNVDRCGEGLFSKWGCFVVSINERAPRYLGIVDGEPWVIAEDATFLVPATNALKEEAEGRYRGVVALEGLASRHQSPDLVRSQIAFASHTIEQLEKVVKRSVHGLNFEGRGDVGVTFEGLRFPVVFSSSGDSSVSLSEQAERCNKLLAQLHARLNDVERIDLAFSQVGVVKFKGPA